jgi:hypothetical protein
MTHLFTTTFFGATFAATSRCSDMARIIHHFPRREPATMLQKSGCVWIG